MKTSTLPSIRVSPETRKQAESLLREGESLSSFVADALAKHLQHRRADEEFLARGLASAARAKRTGEYVSASAVLRKLEGKLRDAKSKRR